MFTYGSKFRITIYGASHEESMGVIIDGIKPGIKIDTNKIDDALNLRRPNLKGTTKRKENDNYKIVSGYYNEFTTGGPVHIIVENNNIRSKDYSKLEKNFRPNHADFVANIKYQGFNDYRGGGFFSGRLTTLLVIAGCIAKQINNYHISSNIIQIGNSKDTENIDSFLDKVIENKDSVGGIVELTAKNIPIGLGDPYFNKLDAAIAHMMITIPGVRGIIFGKDFDVTKPGSINNDLFIDSNGKTSTNHSGGIVGGISNGNDIVFKVLVKPTSSIGLPQETFNFETNKIDNLVIEGRHDVAFIRRIPIVLESVLALVLINM